jgi:5-methylcytosine-specific restriction enzyme A
MALKTLKPSIGLAPQRIAVTQATKRIRGSALMATLERIKMRDHGMCQACLVKGIYRVGQEVDHKVRLADGGPETDENRWLLCVECHKAKTQGESQL